MAFCRAFTFFILLFTGVLSIHAQTNQATIRGTITDSLKNPLQGVSIAVMGKPGGTVTDAKGWYVLQIPAGSQITVAFSSLGYKPEFIIALLKPNEDRIVDKEMFATSMALPAVEVKNEDLRTDVMNINTKDIDRLPNVSGSIEGILKTLPGVVSNNELTSQYSVRGGNFDENLVYVNDIEVFRPILIRSGQQEGLSFVNSSMVEAVKFSAGGFDAKYGDKLSSVLDIKYRKPTEFSTSVLGSFQGANITTEGLSKNNRLTYIAGFRYKTNQYILSSLDTKGQYKPNFTDFQTYLTYSLAPKWDLEFLGNYSRNEYRVVPDSQNTTFGTFDQALHLHIFFEGQEIDKFETYSGAFATSYHPNKDLKLRFIASVFKTSEQVAYDVMGAYRIGELERDFSKENFGKDVSILGVGAYMNHARSQMDGLVSTIEHKGYLSKGSHYILWGIMARHEQLSDKVKQWNLLDSADYVIPKPGNHFLPVGSNNPINFQDLVRNNADITNNRGAAYIQDSYHFGEHNNMQITGGVRASYMQLSNQMLFSPRASFSYKPKNKKNLEFRASAGLYYQPPFFREYRDYQGNINTGLQAQRSIHYVLGSDYQFSAWGKPLKLVSELYYKDMSSLITYKVDNVAIRYVGNNNTVGYATGIDFRLNGEFVKGLESWFSLSVMQTKENLLNDSYYTYYNKSGEQIIPRIGQDRIAADSIKHIPGYVPRPTDQRVTCSIMFQDHLPKYPKYRVNLNLVFGSGLPIGPPGNDRYKDTLRLPFYRRVDIGFTRELITENTFKDNLWKPLQGIKTAWISFEVFNLLDIDNTVSYLWIKDISNRQYGVPNYLTPRLINLKLFVKF